MNAPTLYLAFAHGDEAVVARVLDWSHRDSRHEDDPRPLVALEVHGSPGAWHTPHVLAHARLREAVVSEDPEVARTVITQRQIGEWLDGDAPDPEDALDWTDLEDEAS